MAMRSSDRAVAIKICGITRLDDAEAALDLGVEAIGLNFWSGSKRRCELSVARAIAQRVGDRARLVAVVVDASASEIDQLRTSVGLGWIQLHGDETDDFVRSRLPTAYRAVRATGDEGYQRALAAPGIEVLLDAAVPGQKGGTGARADWTLAHRVARARPLWLAGGLTPENIAQAVREVRPFGVDVASGVESAPGIKDRARMDAFVRAARDAAPTERDG